MAYLGPLILITGISLIKEIYDEISRKLKDNKFNAEKFTKIQNGEKI